MEKIDINDVVDRAKFNRFHFGVMMLCALLLIFDGYDLFIYGVVLPVLMDEWSLTPVQAGALGSYALFGMMFGAFIFGPMADRIGRKKGVMICFVLFSLATFLTGFAESTTQFGILRFIAGLGCGGLMPNAVALMNEYAPRRSRGTLVALMFSGYSLGGVLAAGIGIFALPRFGWEFMFFAAIIPLLLVPILMWKLPESIGFLVRENKNDQARQMLAKLSPNTPINAQTELTQNITKANSVPVLDLFKEDRLLGTLMIWLAFFCCLLMVYALGSWLPKLMANAGYSLGSSLSFLLALNFGGMFGAILGGWLGDRFGLPRVMAWFFVASAVSISLLGFNSPMIVLYTLIVIAGATTIGTQILLYANTAQFYPLSVRSTGLGWASGIGRTGAIAGPFLGGTLMAMALPLKLNFFAFAIPGVIATLAILLFIFASQRQARSVKRAAAVVVS
ncbi:MFS transporter [Oligella ureolytica]|nr:MFS transporter [Oligella sp.]